MMKQNVQDFSLSQVQKDLIILKEDQSFLVSYFDNYIHQYRTRSK